MSVLLDLHGGPGSQNGIDHSGCSMSGVQWDTPMNVRLSLDAIRAMAVRYGKRPNLFGIELLNEPSHDLAQEHQALLDYYTKAYDIVRRECHKCRVVINELYPEFYSKWKGDLAEPSFYNVVMDWHLYNWQQPYENYTATQHISAAKSWAGLLEKYDGDHPVVVGEWSMSTGPSRPQVGKRFIDTCLASFRHGLGSFDWNWKIERGLGFDSWSAQVATRKKLLDFSDSADPLERA